MAFGPEGLRASSAPVEEEKEEAEEEEREREREGGIESSKVVEIRQQSDVPHSRHWAVNYYFSKRTRRSPSTSCSWCAESLPRARRPQRAMGTREQSDCKKVATAATECRQVLVRRAH